MAITIIIDSASDINFDEARKIGVTLMSMEVRINGKDYLDGVNLTPKAFYEKLIESDDLPTTSLINTFRWEESFEKEVNNGNEVIVITISSKLSGTYASAVEASNRFTGKVFVVDSLSASIGERLLLQYALNIAKNGLSASEIVKELNIVKSKINVMAMLNTLQYLKKGGRISATVAFAGELLSIKPVVAVIDGEVKLIGKALGSKRANNLLNTLVDKKGIDFDKPYGVIWSGIDDTLIKKYVDDSANLWQTHTDNIPSYMIGSAIGTHVGPGAIGVAFFEK